MILTFLVIKNQNLITCLHRLWQAITFIFFAECGFLFRVTFRKVTHSFIHSFLHYYKQQNYMVRILNVNKTGICFEKALDFKIVAISTNYATIRVRIWKLEAVNAKTMQSSWIFSEHILPMLADWKSPA